MWVDFLNRTHITPDEVDSFDFKESDPNDCGVLMDYISIDFYIEKKERPFAGESLTIEVAKHKGRYYGGYNYWIQEGGASSAPSVDTEYSLKNGFVIESYSTPREAIYAILDKLCNQRHVKGMASKFAKEFRKQQCIQYTLW